MTAGHAAIREQLEKSGADLYVTECRNEYDGEKPCLRGIIGLGVLAYLKKHPQFTPPIPAINHAEVGRLRTEYRSKKGSLGEGALQIVVGIQPKAYAPFYADLDGWNPSESLEGLAKHNLFEVWGPKLKRLFTKKKDA